MCNFQDELHEVCLAANKQEDALCTALHQDCPPLLLAWAADTTIKCVHLH
jgi:hypothetical protein